MSERIEDGKKRMGEETVGKQACPAILTLVVDKGQDRRRHPRFDLWQDGPRNIEGQRQGGAFGSKRETLFPSDSITPPHESITLLRREVLDGT